MSQPQTAVPAPEAGAPGSEAGFSVIEGLIAALLLLVITLGILPLFSRAMNNNVKGNDSTRRANGVTDAFETAVALPFNSGAMSLTAGNALTVTETIALKRVASPTGGENQALSSRWELPAALASGDIRMLDRVRRLQQYSFDDFADNQTFDNPLDASTEPRLVHLKVMDVTVLDPQVTESQPYVVRVVQAY